MKFSERRAFPEAESGLKIDWRQCLKLAKAGACQGVIAWFAGSEVRGGRVEGAVGHLTPGSIRSNGFFRQSMWTAMVTGGAPELVASPFADAVWNSWKAWFDGYEIKLEYPSLAAVEGALAGPVPNKPVLFSKGKSSADFMLGSESLAANIERALLSIAMLPGAHEASFWFAEWFSERFTQWQGGIWLMNILGSGPVPSYAPPVVTSGPVAGGTLLSRRPLLTDQGVFQPPR